MNSDTSLANLTVMFTETCINCCTARTNLSMEFLCKFEQHVETFLRTHTVTTCDNNRSTFQVMFSFFHVAVDNFNNIVCFRNKLSHVVTNNLTLIVFIKDFLLHHTLTNCSHLWTMLRIDDSGNDVTTESRTNLIKQIFVCNTCLLILMTTYFQLSTVGSQTTSQCRRNTRAKVTTDNGSTHKTNLRFFLLEKIYENR